MPNQEDLWNSYLISKGKVSLLQCNVPGCANHTQFVCLLVFAYLCGLCVCPFCLTLILFVHVPLVTYLQGGKTCLYQESILTLSYSWVTSLSHLLYLPCHHLGSQIVLNVYYLHYISCCTLHHLTPHV